MNVFTTHLVCFSLALFFAYADGSIEALMVRVLCCSISAMGCDPRLVFIQVGVSVDAHTFLLSHIVYLKRVLQSFDKALT